MKNIVILDGFCLNPGDLSWDFLHQLGQVTYYDKTEPSLDEYIQKCKNAEVIIINKSGLILDKSLFVHCPNLKYIIVSATGYNIINVQDANKFGINVSNIPAYSTPAVAQHTFALILELFNKVGAYNQTVQQGFWQNATHWSYNLEPLQDLANLSLGLIGMGSIAQKVAQIANSFDMKVMYTANSDKNMPSAQFVSLDNLLQNADIVSLHCPANGQTSQMVNLDFLQKMKPNSILINTARGQLINETDLAKALHSNLIKGAALDVLTQEPPALNNPLIGLTNCLITPHIAWSSVPSRQRVMQVIEQNIIAFNNGNPINLVN